MLDTQTLEIPCPHCGHKTSKTVAWLQVNNQLTCEGCHNVINLQSDKFRAGIEEAANSVDELRRTIRQFGKR